MGNYYGTFTRCIITMFEVTLANWGPPCRALINTLGEEFGYVILVYRCVAGFTVLNVISAVFINQTMKVAEADTHLMISQKMRAQANYTHRLRKLFEELDVSGHGAITWEEFSEKISHPKMMAYMSTLGIDPLDLEA